MAFDFDTVYDRRHMLSVKYDVVPEDVLPLWVADMDFKTAPAITKALDNFIKQGIYGYAKIPNAYYEAIKNWHLRREGIIFEKEWILPIPGIVPAISATLGALTLPGDQVIIQSPVYNCFFSSIRNQGLETIDNQLILDDKHCYHMDLEDLKIKLQHPRARVLLLCNPQNPGSRLWTYAELAELVAICKEKNIIVISDEIHCDLRANGSEFTSLAKFTSELKDRLVIFRSASKAFNLAGLQNAYIICKDSYLRERIDRQININEVCDLNPLGIIATIAALNEGQNWLEELNDYIEGNYRYLKEFLEKNCPQIKLTPLSATYLAWLDIKGLNLSSKKFCHKLLAEGKVLLSCGEEYGAGGDGFVRLNLACPQTTLKQALDRILKIVTDL